MTCLKCVVGNRPRPSPLIRKQLIDRTPSSDRFKRVKLNRKYFQVGDATLQRAVIYFGVKLDPSTCKFYAESENYSKFV